MDIIEKYREIEGEKDKDEETTTHHHWVDFHGILFAVH